VFILTNPVQVHLERQGGQDGEGREKERLLEERHAEKQDANQVTSVYRPEPKVTNVGVVSLNERTQTKVCREELDELGRTGNERDMPL
jgi:hypothetical protein